MRTKYLPLTGIFVLLTATASFANPINQPPPIGAILDLNGTSIPQSAQTYTVNFTAALANTAITFAFRDDPSFLHFDNVVVTDLTTSSGNLLTNGDFSTGLTGWTYANIYGATFPGVVQNNEWYDGSVQAYDAISQTIATTFGDLYQISFSLFEGSDLPTFSALSTNGNVTDTGGNGIDVLVYAQAGLPARGSVPEPATMLLFGSGIAGLAVARRKKTV